MPVVAGTAQLTSLPAEAIDAILSLAGPGSGSPLDGLELRQAGGALARATDGHGALATIDGAFVLFAAGLALTPEMGAAKHAHIARLKAALSPWSSSGEYLNFAEEAVDVSRSFDADSWSRLRAVKDRLDPEDVIHANHGI